VPPSVISNQFSVFRRSVPSWSGGRASCSCLVLGGRTFQNHVHVCVDTEDPCRLIDQRVSGGSAYQITYTLIQCADLRGPVDSACMRGVWGVGPSRRRTARRTDSIRFQIFPVYRSWYSFSQMSVQSTVAQLLSRNLRVSQLRVLRIFSYSLFDWT
jgi:hypothetical protein